MVVSQSEAHHVCAACDMLHLSVSGAALVAGATEAAGIIE